MEERERQNRRSIRSDNDDALSVCSLILSLEQPPSSHSFPSIFSFLPTFLSLKRRSHLSQKKKMRRESKRQVALITGKLYCSNTVLLLAHCNGISCTHYLWSVLSVDWAHCVARHLHGPSDLFNIFPLVCLIMSFRMCVCVCSVVSRNTTSLSLSLPRPANHMAG